MDVDSNRLSAALQHLYAAPLDAANRSLLPHRMASAFSASSCLMHTRDTSLANISIVGRTANLDQVVPAYIEERYSDDAWSEIAARRRLNVACLGEDVVPETDLVAMDWYNELCRPSEIHHLVGAVFEVDPQVRGLIGVHREANGAAFEGDDRDMMQFLLPHMAQAIRLMRLADADARARRLTFNTLAALSVGVFLVGTDGRLRMLNATAERVARAGSPLRLSNGRVSLSDPKLDDRLRAAVRKASLAPLGRSLCAGETIVVPSGERVALPLMVTPLPPDTATVGPAEPLAAIFIGEPSSRSEPSSELIRAIYGLTPAETRVLLSLLNGERLSDYADKTGISLNTANTQLKSLFAKTDSHRQADLVRKVMGDPMLRLSI